MNIILRYQAFGDLFKRYGKIFRYAWQQRASMDSAHRLPYEAQFLPAALALQETPVSPAPHLAIGGLVTFAVLTLVWASFGHIDVVATAHGKIVPNDRTKMIQPFETATIKAIHITDGQTVKAGEVLIELDATTARADKNRILGELSVARLQVARGQAMLVCLKGGEAPQLKSPINTSASMFQEAERLLWAQHGEYRAKINRIDAEIAKH